MRVIVLELSKVLILQFRSSLSAVSTLFDDLCLDLISTPLTTLVYKLCQLKEWPNYVRFLIVRHILFFSGAEFSLGRFVGDICEIFGGSYCTLPPWHTISSCFIAASECYVKNDGAASDLQGE